MEPVPYPEEPRAEVSKVSSDLKQTDEIDRVKRLVRENQKQLKMNYSKHWLTTATFLPYQVRRWVKQTERSIK